jgi:FtsP/CotA-like multicopper oxidase with cupredoxin domain
VLPANTDFPNPLLVPPHPHHLTSKQVHMVHCHDLEHEDGDMMLNLKVAG